MTTLDHGMAALRTGYDALRAVAASWLELYERSESDIEKCLPEGSFRARLLIIIVPMVVRNRRRVMFMEPALQSGSRNRLSAGMVQDIAVLIEMYKLFPQAPDHAQIRRNRAEKLGLVVDFLPVNELPRQARSRFFFDRSGAVRRSAQSRSAALSG